MILYSYDDDGFCHSPARGEFTWIVYAHLLHTAYPAGSFSVGAHCVENPA